jgi:hypothetical protein
VSLSPLAMVLAPMALVAAIAPEAGPVLVFSAAGGGTETDPQAGMTHRLAPRIAAAIAPAFANLVVRRLIYDPSCTR